MKFWKNLNTGSTLMTILLSSVSVLFFWSCYPDSGLTSVADHDVIITQFDPDKDYSTFQTYFLVDSIEHIEQQARADSLAKLDSIKRAKERNKYHIISGSFRNSSYAERFNDRMKSEYNYDSKIVVGNNGFNLVAIKSLPTMGVAIRELRSIRDEGRFEAWIYIEN